MNTFEYQSNFFKIVQVQVTHEYYVNLLYNKVIIKPTSETAATLRNLEFVFKPLSYGFVLLFNGNSNQKITNAVGPIDFHFTMKITDDTFLNITDIPFRYHQAFHFHNGHENPNQLHDGIYAGEQSMESSNQPGITANIHLVINKQNELFGNGQDINFQTLNYGINFKSRAVVIRYNFYGTRKDDSNSSFFIVDSKNNKMPVKRGQRTLANGLDVFTMELENPVTLKDRMEEFYTLKKEDEFFRSFSLSLPQPDSKNISYDKKGGLFFADIFSKIN